MEPSPPNGDAPSADEAGDDRRIAERGPIALRVDYKRLNSFFADYTKNISRGGTFIRTDRPLAVGTEFVFELGIPVPSPELGDGSIRLAGVVRWVVLAEEATDDKPAGMGIGFLFPSKEAEASFAELVEKLMRGSLGDAISERLLARKPAP